MDTEEKVIEITPEQANEIRNECRKTIEFSNMLKRLENNADFKKLFIEEYVRSEPARLTALLAEPSFNASDKAEYYRNDIKERLIGIARFGEYLRNVHMLAARAEKELADLNEAE